jgi:predicted dehydrogenase
MRPLLLALLFAVPVYADDKKVGIIGCDTTHVPAFTKLLNEGKNPALAGYKVVAAFPGGSDDIPASKNRKDGFVKTLRETYGVEIVGSVEELVKKVDVVLLESVDGRPHLEQASPVIKAKKPLFIDKPVAGSLADAIRIFDLAKEHGSPVFSSSSLRYYPGVVAVKNDEKLGKIVGCSVHSSCELEPHHPDLFWYGIHGVETLFTIMGTGCESVSRTHTKDTDVVTGTWKDGRIGTYRGLRGGAKGSGGTVYGEKSIAALDMKGGGYEVLLVEIVKFWKTGQAPVSAEETIELFAFMEAADESKRKDGAPVTLESVIKKAKER